jgi:phosphatidylinositol kinase/protein kinase (PI-3  family)
MHPLFQRVRTSDPHRCSLALLTCTFFFRSADLNERGGAFGGGTRRRGEENEELRGVDGREVQNQHAIKVIQRIQDKLTGRDFKASVVLPIDVQVQKLIEQATSMENLCQCFIGWCKLPFRLPASRSLP